MIQEIDIKEVPITIETAHQFFNKREMRFIVKMKKEEYKQGFLNGMKMKVVAMLLFSIASFGQSSIVASGNETYTIGETFPIMQTVQKQKEVSLGTPKFEPPKEAPKPIIKKKLTWWQKLLKSIFG